MSTETRGNLITRRVMLQHGLMGGMGAMLAQRLLAQPPAAAKPGKAKAVIQIWLWGGPSHIDSFDPKPSAGNDYSGPLNSPIATNVKGMIISELMPQLAKQADKFSIIRSMTHGNNGHETAAYLVQTGRNPSDRVVHPSMGAVVCLFKGKDESIKRGLVPPYIVLTQPQGRFSEAGFLGSRYKPFFTGGDPGAARFVVEGLVGQLTEMQMRERRDLMQRLNTLGSALKNQTTMQALAKSEDQAYDLILGDAGKLFDLNTEKDELRTKYGRTTFGQSCLMARRLVERGVPYVTINYGGWDTHKDHFPAMRRKLPELDKGLASLFEDLKQRGLLDSTIVWCCGEFGRTPKVAWEAPWSGGRHHFGNVFSAVVGGGGFKGGHVVGESDSRAESVKNRPVYPGDLIGSMYELLGIDPEGKLPHPQGLQIKVTPDSKDEEESGGRLKEII
ncbi:MAG: DUF1501 domain-containing protein [Gemmataceae bacterium]